MTRKSATILWAIVLVVVMLGAVVSRSNPSFFLLRPIPIDAFKVGGAIVIIGVGVITWVVMSQDRLLRRFGSNRPIINVPHNAPVSPLKQSQADSDDSGDSDNSDTVVLSRDTMVVAQNPQPGDPSSDPDVPPSPMDPKLLLLFHEELAPPQQSTEDKKDKDEDD